MKIQYFMQFISCIDDAKDSVYSEQTASCPENNISDELFSFTTFMFISPFAEKV